MSAENSLIITEFIHLYTQTVFCYAKIVCLITDSSAEYCHWVTEPCYLWSKIVHQNVNSNYPKQSPKNILWTFLIDKPSQPSPSTTKMFLKWKDWFMVYFITTRLLDKWTPKLCFLALKHLKMCKWKWMMWIIYLDGVPNILKHAK